MILFEDNHILVAVKPQNVPSQADSSGDPDFLSQLKEYIKLKYNKPGNVYLGLVHRLDRPTGGIMVFARTSKAAARLSAQVREHTFSKTYAAVVSSPLSASADLRDYVLKDTSSNTSAIVSPAAPGAKLALLHYDVLQQSADYSLLQIALQTGRSHQIRVQLAHAGAPLVGDVKYAGAPCEKLCLYAFLLAFDHPVTKERLTFTVPLPNYKPWNLFQSSPGQL